SRALNDAPDIGEATKEKVREIARQIGYSPNRAGLRLRTGKTNVIALILSTEHDMMNHTARLITAIASGTRGTPYHMIVTPYFPDQDPMDPVRYVTETGSADGIIINQTQPRDPRVRHLMDIGFPFATHGRTDWSEQHPFYDFHNGTFGAISVRRLFERGRRNILLVAPPQDQFYSIEMIETARAEADRLGVRFAVLESASSDDGANAVEAGVSDELRRGGDFDGVIAASTTAAMAVAVAIEKHGGTIGGDVDLIAKEALPFLRRFRNEILVIPEDVTQAGRFLCRAVMQAIDDPEAPPMQYLETPSG
ncbi:MAG: LacI family transcriptional regulator, partial [Silicimonas sp.]|nr:LacI family transcriptional regulator [Silicimonas sp.]